MHAVAATDVRPPVIFLGEGPDAEALRATARDLGVRLTVQRIDGAEDLANLLASAVYVHPRSTLDEGFPTSVLEALTVGAPTLVAPFSGMGDYVTPGSNVRVYRSVDELSSLLDSVWVAPEASTGATPSWRVVADTVGQMAVTDA